MPGGIVLIECLETKRAVGGEDLPALVAAFTIELVDDFLARLAIHARGGGGRLMAEAILLINRFRAVGIDRDRNSGRIIGVLRGSTERAQNERESGEKVKSESEHAHWRQNTRRKKSVQTGIYFIDRRKLEWFKVGESGLIWINSPAAWNQPLHL
jgi:hypothetical protein